MDGALRWQERASCGPTLRRPCRCRRHGVDACCRGDLWSGGRAFELVMCVGPLQQLVLLELCCRGSADAGGAVRAQGSSCTGREHLHGAPVQKTGARAACVAHCRAHTHAMQVGFSVVHSPQSSPQGGRLAQTRHSTASAQPSRSTPRPTRHKQHVAYCCWRVCREVPSEPWPPRPKQERSARCGEPQKHRQRKTRTLRSPHRSALPHRCSVHLASFCTCVWWRPTKPRSPARARHDGSTGAAGGAPRPLGCLIPPRSKTTLNSANYCATAAGGGGCVLCASPRPAPGGKRANRT